MVKKKQQLPVGGLTSLFSSSNKQPSSSAAWQWTSCGLHPRTLSFRQQQQEEDDAIDEKLSMEAKELGEKHELMVLQ